MAFKQVLGMLGGLPKRAAIYKLMPCRGYDLGYFCLRYWPGRGHDYFRVDSIADLYQEANAARSGDSQL